MNNRLERYCCFVGGGVQLSLLTKDQVEHTLCVSTLVGIHIWIVGNKIKGMTSNRNQ